MDGILSKKFLLGGAIMHSPKLHPDRIVIVHQLHIITLLSKLVLHKAEKQTRLHSRDPDKMHQRVSYIVWEGVGME